MVKYETDPVTGFVPPGQPVPDNKASRRAKARARLRSAHSSASNNVVVPASWEDDETLEKPAWLPDDWSEEDETYSSSETDEVMDDPCLIPGPPHLSAAEKIKHSEYVVATMFALQKRRTYEGSGCSIPFEFNLLLNFKKDCDPCYGYPVIEKLASMAIENYNLHEQTTHEFVDVVKLGWKMGGGSLWYYLIFQARDSDQLDTFEAEVRIRRLDEVKFENKVLCVRNSNPESKWIHGTLSEIVLN